MKYSKYAIFDRAIYSKIVSTKDENNIYIAQKTVNKQQYKIVELTSEHVIMHAIVGGVVDSTPVVVVNN